MEAEDDVPTIALLPKASFKTTCMEQLNPTSIAKSVKQGPTTPNVGRDIVDGLTTTNTFQNAPISLP